MGQMNIWTLILNFEAVLSQIESSKPKVLKHIKLKPVLLDSFN